ncbi:hypothetical protein [Actinoplanes palleronii]|uniref:DUF4436 domain-containing protein n=1 Tax=Actinoplanes palleronii TaxID=113570 RepID=A0ABQ4B240_9ACTN|nr:hypothetical protein [Actinoplanes palleronii]GIE64731.1 hypothetical protein Apa02nite_008390 [Actinoplanes palleronii]
MSILATDVQHTGHRAGHRILRWCAVAVVALTVAAALAGCGAWLGWRDAGPLPSDQRATALAGELLPGARVGGIERQDTIFGSDSSGVAPLILGDDEYAGGSVLLPVDVPDVAEVRATLERTGWRILPDSGRWDLAGVAAEAYVTARRDDVEIAVYHDDLGFYQDDHWVAESGIVFWHPEPALVRPLALLGWGLGLLLGGWAALKVTARQSGRRPWRRSAWIGSALLALPTLAVTGELFAPAVVVPPDPPGALWEPYVLFPALVIAGTAAWARALVVRLRRAG